MLVNTRTLQLNNTEKGRYCKIKVKFANTMYSYTLLKVISGLNVFKRQVHIRVGPQGISCAAISWIQTQGKTK